MGINRNCLNKRYGPVEMNVNASIIEAYADATLDASPLYRKRDPVAPPVFGVVPAWAAIQDALADEELRIDLGRIVHGQQKMIFHRLIRAGDHLKSVGSLSSITEKGPNEIFALSFETRDEADRLVTTQDVICVSRGTGSGASQPTASSGSGSSNLAEQPALEPDITRTIELPEDITFRYAKASGDDNRIHIDEDFAVRVGLPGIIVQGMCLFSIALQVVIDLVGKGDPGSLRSASARFLRPMQPGAAFQVTAIDGEKDARFEGRSSVGKPILRGMAGIV